MRATLTVLATALFWLSGSWWSYGATALWLASMAIAIELFRWAMEDTYEAEQRALDGQGTDRRGAARGDFKAAS